MGNVDLFIMLRNENGTVEKKAQLKQINKELTSENSVERISQT